MNIERRYKPERGAPAPHVFSSARMLELRGGEQQRVRLWNRGAMCGDLVLTRPDGDRLLSLLRMEEEVHDG